MSIKNPDGSIFQLKKPNPLLKQQDMADDVCVAHNLNIFTEEVTVKYKQKKKPVAPNGAVIGTPEYGPAIPEQPTATAPAQDIKPMPPPRVAEQEAVLSQPEPEPADEEDDKYMEEDDEAMQDVVSCWCHPAEYRKHVDPLYGETRKTPAWGDKFMFDGTVLQNSEMAFIIWAQVKITPPSIIFIRAHRRWWRVTEVQPHDGGYAMTCRPSDVRTSFD